SPSLFLSLFPLSLTHSLTLSLSLSLSPLSLTHSFCLSLSPSLSLSLSLSPALSPSLSLTRSLVSTPSPPHFFSIPTPHPPLSLPFSQLMASICPLLTHSLTHSLTLTHSHSLSLSL